MAAQSQALAALCGAKLTGGTGQERSRFAYRLATVRSAVLRQVDERSDYNTERRRYEVEHFEEKEKDGQTQRDFKRPAIEHRRAFEDAMEGLLSVEVEVDMPVVTLDEIAAFGIDLTGEQMDLLRFCIAEPAEVPAKQEAPPAPAAQPA